MRRYAATLTIVAFVSLGSTAAAWAQGRPKPVAPPSSAAPGSPPPARPVPAAPAEAPVPTPSEATLGVPFYPTMQFIASYDAGLGQRFFLFGTTASFSDVVSFYKSVLKQRGELVFEEPATHMFDIARFREETMAFPPSVTIKDYTWGGMRGYLNPKPGAEPARYPTIIQIVPIPAAPAEARR